MGSQEISTTESVTKRKQQNEDNWNDKIKIVKIADVES